MALYGQDIPHITWRQYCDVNPLKFAKYFKFAVIRDPLTRFTSAFDFLKTGGINQLDETFGMTILKPFSDANELAKALVTRDLQAEVLRWWHFRPQVEFIADERGGSKMDFLIRFENIHAGFMEVANRLNCKSCELPHLNKTRVRVELDLDDRARDVLFDLYKQDFTLWRSIAEE